MNTYDLVIKGGCVVDPASRREGQYNIAVREGQIATLTSDAVRGVVELDASGFVVTPGFVDIHNHVDGMLNAGQCMVRMGVTTVIGGNCGMIMHAQEKDIAAFLDRIDVEGFPVNHGMLIGAQDLRNYSGVAGPDKAADRSQLCRMVELAEKAMDKGALGISFCLAAEPGISQAEIIELFKAAARMQGIVAVHPRYFGPGIPGMAQDAVAGEQELISASRASNAKLQISHLTSQLAWKSEPYDTLLIKGLEIIESAREEGLDIMADSYPYSAWCMFPEGALLDAILAPAVSKYLKLDLSMIEVVSGPFKGQRVTRDLFLRIKKEAPKSLLVGHTMRPDLVDRIFLSPFVMVASDGVYDQGSGRPGHPRGAGTFPRILKRLVRGKKHLSLMEALYKMTTMPAHRFGLSQKGCISVGADADLVVFDPKTVEDCATYVEPDLGVKGIEHVVVAGRVVVKDGQLTDARPGKSVRLNRSL